MNGRLPLEHGSDRPQTLAKRVSDDLQHFIFRRRKKLFREIFGFEIWFFEFLFFGVRGIWDLATKNSKGATLVRFDIFYSDNYIFDIYGSQA